MNHILSNLYEYIKVGKFTGIFILTLVSLASLKYLPLTRFQLKISPRLLLILIFTLGVVLRIGWLCYSSHEPRMTWDERGMAETDLVNIYAIEMTQGTWFEDSEGKPTGRRPIGYPLFLGLLYKIFGVNIWVAWAGNVVLFAVSLFFLHRLTRVVFSEQPALIASFLFAVYPISIFSVKLLTDENLFLPVWYGGLYLLFHNMRNGRFKYQWLWYGLIFGFAAMTRTHAILMPFVVGYACFAFNLPWRKILLYFVLTALTMQLINLPWVIRNYRVWNVPVLYSATGYYLYFYHLTSTSPEDLGRVPVASDPGYSEAFAKIYSSANEGVLHKESNRLLSKLIRENPLKFFVRGTYGLLYFMGINKRGVWPLWYQYYEGHFDPERPLSEKVKKKLEDYAYIFYYILFYSTLLSLVIICRKWKAWQPEKRKFLVVFLLNIFLYLALLLIVFPFRKYRYPIEPLMISIASYFFYYLLTQFRWESLIWRKQKTSPSHVEEY